MIIKLDESYLADRKTGIIRHKLIEDTIAKFGNAIAIHDDYIKGDLLDILEIIKDFRAKAESNRTNG